MITSWAVIGLIFYFLVENNQDVEKENPYSLKLEDFDQNEYLGENDSNSKFLDNLNEKDKNSYLNVNHSPSKSDSSYDMHRKIGYYDDQIEISNSRLACKPDKFGYTPDEFDFWFPDKSYPRCEDLYKSKPESLYINFTSNELIMECVGGVYVLGQDKENLEYYTFDNPILSYGSPVTINNQEYAFGSCNKSQRSDFEHFFYQPRPKIASLNRAKSKLKSKPINFIMLVFDSLSRRMAFKKLPKTIDLLNNLDPKFELYDFKLQHVLGKNSVDFVIPVLLGGIFENGDFDIENPVWKYLHEHGFVSLIGSDICHEDGIFAGNLGKDVDADHILGSIWCAARKLLGYDQSLQKERCFGNRNVHTVMMDYMLDYLEIYKNVSRFSYLHINTAHEDTGSVISTLDDDLVDFLTDLMARDEETVLFIKGDHGNRAGGWLKNAAGANDHHLTAAFLVVTKSFLNRIPNSRGNLKSNENKLVSASDFYSTIMSMANYPNFIDIKEFTNKRVTSYNLFTEVIPESRTCKDIHCNNDWCGCLAVNYLEEKWFYSDHIQTIAKEILHTINLINNCMGPDDSCHCKYMSLDRILKVGELIDYPKLERFYKYTIKIKEDQNVTFTADVKLAVEPIVIEAEYDLFKCKNIIIEDMKYFKIKTIDRLDDYKQKCLAENLENQQDQVMCLCK